MASGLFTNLCPTPLPRPPQRVHDRHRPVRVQGKLDVSDVCTTGRIRDMCHVEAASGDGNGGDGVGSEGSLVTVTSAGGLHVWGVPDLEGGNAEGTGAELTLPLLATHSLKVGGCVGRCVCHTTAAVFRVNRGWVQFGRQAYQRRDLHVVLRRIFRCCIHSSGVCVILYVCTHRWRMELLQSVAIFFSTRVLALTSTS